MPLQIAPVPLHLPGETKLPSCSAPTSLPDHLQVDTCGGRVRVEWDPHAPVTPLGQLVFFAQFLETSGRLALWVGDCPWVYTSPNAPVVRDVCGTLLLSVLSGHHRYAHGKERGQSRLCVNWRLTPGLFEVRLLARWRANSASSIPEPSIT
jgi:hypothetical protein